MVDVWSGGWVGERGEGVVHDLGLKLGGLRM